jgi:hypothetical protein
MLIVLFEKYLPPHLAFVNSNQNIAKTVRMTKEFHNIRLLTRK